MPPTGKSSVETETAMLQARWQDSVVSIWTPTAHGSGFSIGANGLIATSQRVVGNATTIEVQLSSTLKVAATVVGIDAERGRAILSIDPKAAAAVKPVTLECGQAQGPAAESEGHHHRIDAAPAEADDVGHHERARCASHLVGSLIGPDLRAVRCSRSTALWLD